MGGLYEIACLLDWQHAAVVRERMNDHDRVLTRFDHFVEITDRSFTRRDRERTIQPYRLVAANEIASGQVARGKVVVACDRHERALETPRHVLDEARLSTTRRTFEHDRQAALVAPRKDLDLVPRREVIRLGVEAK